jgi:hypothetical protein
MGVMMILYFISALIVTTHIPDKVGERRTNPHPSKEVCMDIVRINYDSIENGIKYQLGKYFVKVLEMKCMTHNEAVELNSKLGH